MTTIYPIIGYQDLGAATEFLKYAFGFEEHLAVQGDDGEMQHLELKLGDAIVMPAPAGKTINEGQTVPLGTMLYVAVGDPDELCERARSAGAAIVEEPVDREYGSREFAAKDLEGNVWYFGTYEPKI